MTTYEDRQQIIANYLAGQSTRAIAHHTGRSPSGVIYILRQSGIPLRPRGGQPDYTEQRRARIIAAYRNGDSIRAIAEAEGASYSGIRHVLCRAGVQMRGRGRRRGKP